MIDPRDGRQSFELLVLGSEGKYIAAHPYDQGRLWSSVLPGVWFDPTWQTAEKLPRVTLIAMRMVENPQHP